MTSINCLNEECLIKIFEYADIFQIQKVCTRWRDVALRSWRTFQLYNTSIWGIDEYGTLYIDIFTLQEHLKHYGGCLKGLIIDEPKGNCINPKSRIQIPELNEKALSIILPYCPNLRYVKAFLKYNPIYATQFLSNHCEHLTDLNLSCQGFDHFDDERRFQNALDRLFESKKKLKRLNFKGPMRGKSLEYLPSDMKEIFIRSYTVDSVFLVKALSTFHKLQKLELEGSKNIAGLFKALEFCSKSLKALILRDCRSAHIKGEEVPNLSSLEILKLQKNSWLKDDFLLKAGEFFKRLKSLTIEEDNHSFDEGLSGLIQLPLEELNLTLCKKIGPAISQLRTLRSLSLQSPFVDLDILCDVIKNCPKLKELYVVNYDRTNWNCEDLEAAALTAENRASSLTLKIWVDGKFWKDVKRCFV